MVQPNIESFLPLMYFALISNQRGLGEGPVSSQIGMDDVDQFFGCLVAGIAGR